MRTSYRSGGPPARRHGARSDGQPCLVARAEPEDIAGGVEPSGPRRVLDRDRTAQRRPDAGPCKASVASTTDRIPSGKRRRMSSTGRRDVEFRQLITRQADTPAES